MKKILVSGIVIVAFALYAIFYHKPTSTVPATTGEGNTGAGTTSAVVTSGKTSAKSGQYTDGTYTGSVADAYYGKLQVKAIIQNGRITDVIFLKYPDDQQESLQVSNAAMPILKQEAIQVQNAQVDIVSGATQTSQAFKQSLASALSQAK